MTQAQARAADGDGADDAADDSAELAGYVEVWWQAVGDLIALLEELDDDDWSRPTDLAGWDVHACAAHTAHLESRLAGAAEETADIGEPAHVRGPMGAYTEVGVVNRRGLSPADVVAELRTAATARHDALLADPPRDGDAHPEHLLGGLPWTWRTVLRNRPLDVWMHEQDIRRATGRPGHLDTAAADHVTAQLADGVGFVLGKRAAAPPGSTLVLEIAGLTPAAFEVGDDRRGRRLGTVPADPTVTLRTDRETFVVLAGGRDPARAERVEITGDAALGRTVVAHLAMTP